MQGLSDSVWISHSRFTDGTGHGGGVLLWNHHRSLPGRHQCGWLGTACGGVPRCVGPAVDLKTMCRSNIFYIIYHNILIYTYNYIYIYILIQLYIYNYIYTIIYIYNYIYTPIIYIHTKYIYIYILCIYIYIPYIIYIYIYICNYFLHMYKYVCISSSLLFHV